jgi:diaminohydroxyphosphoribosylaminopyrimidine deaminase/5-amino-6-(5-phosphoribosylamino)uracil reductase
MTRRPIDMDEKMMLRAIEIALSGMGNVAPNPMVGCVITCKNKIIGEGYHCQYGKSHAEVNAVNSVKNKDLLKESTLYVTLEPCSHHGKTPPCSDMILQNKIPNVVVGTADPFNGMAGRGIEKLRSGGCGVINGSLEEKCIWLNRRFFTFHQKKRPYIILKWAQTADGFMDIDRSDEHYGRPTWITNDLSRIAVHKMRAEESAILVGTNTAKKDNPSLTVREWSGRSPLRLLIDKDMKLPAGLALFDRSVPTVVYAEKESAGTDNIEFKRILFNGLEVGQILADLHERGILSLIVEGGQILLNSFINADIWDEARVFEGNMNFHRGVKAPVFKGIRVKSEALDGCWMYVYHKITADPSCNNMLPEP